VPFILEHGQTMGAWCLSDSPIRRPKRMAPDWARITKVRI